MKKRNEQFHMMIIHYSLIKMHLIGLSVYYKENFGLEQVVGFIQSFSKTVEHNSIYLNGIYDILSENNLMTMAYMAVLIKN